MVVGAGQSGTQIAYELATASKKVFLSVGATSLRVPRQVSISALTAVSLSSVRFEGKTSLGG